jgi:hypothetical protein
MREGKFFRIPESPADVERLWNEAEPIDPSRLPDWLTAEEADGYRYAGSASGPDPLRSGQEEYVAEMEALMEAGLVVDEGAEGGRAHHCYIKDPGTAWYNEAVWSIGIYVGESPVSLRLPQGVRNPVLTRADVTDVPAAFVADPFILRVDGTWYMFFEVMNWRSAKGEVGLATSADGVRWTYQRVVLAEPFHLSYPYVFQWRNDCYMIPESYQAGAVRLYRAWQFPTEWVCVGTLLNGPYYADTSVFRHGDKWWLLTDTSSGFKNDTLRLYYADDLVGRWREHPQSPLIEGNAYVARPAGRVIASPDRVLRYTQTCLPYYGTAVRAFEITELTTTSYKEQEVGQSPILGPSGAGWNACGMHHIDPYPMGDGRWIASVDGWYSEKLLKTSDRETG